MAPSNSNPPSLPPTVEEAYRRKCIQLKERYKEIEDENDAYRLRLTRLKRQIQKTRLERAILLEQIAKRTSTNVEDSEGSPSPPPTPKDKPLRLKRGHRKPSLAGGELDAGPTFINSNLRTLSPSSETFSHDQYPSGRNGTTAKPPKRPSNAFEIYCNDTRPILQDKHKDKIAAGEYRLEEELARGWKDLDEKDKQEFQTRYEQELVKWKEGREAFRRGAKEAAQRERHGRRYDGYAPPGGRSRSGGGAARSRSNLAHDDAEDASGADQGEDQDIEMGDADAAEAEDQDQNDTDPETEVEDGQDQDQGEGKSDGEGEGEGED